MTAHHLPAHYLHVYNPQTVLTFDEIKVGMNLRATGIVTPGDWDFTVREKGESSITVSAGLGFTVFDRDDIYDLKFVLIGLRYEFRDATVRPEDPLTTLLCNFVVLTDRLDPQDPEHADILKVKREAQTYLDSQAPKAHKA